MLIFGVSNIKSNKKPLKQAREWYIVKYAGNKIESKVLQMLHIYCPFLCLVLCLHKL